ncbi:hypothetical protein J3D55_002355 [Chryseobacterium ginsenosidimutans]|nr:hypothetical protein [Chryseobacterium ginsenosidimutans]MCS3869439.1 hypothetical protein [Chryseobacterium ginsenosidimutans]
MEDNEMSYPVYSPASVIGIFSHALKLITIAFLVALIIGFIFAKFV